MTREQVKEALERGSKYVQTQGILIQYTYFSIAYYKHGKKYVIKTVMVN